MARPLQLTSRRAARVGTHTKEGDLMSTTTAPTPEQYEFGLSGHELFRGLNDRVRELIDGFDEDEFYFFCECQDTTCTCVLHMTAAEYDALRGSDYFAVLPGHESDEDEAIVSWKDPFLVVRPQGFRRRESGT